MLAMFLARATRTAQQFATRSERCADRSAIDWTLDNERPVFDTCDGVRSVSRRLACTGELGL